MKTIMAARSSHDSFSFSRRYFNVKKKLDDVVDNKEVEGAEVIQAVDSSRSQEKTKPEPSIQHSPSTRAPRAAPRKKLYVIAVSKMKSALALARARARSRLSSGLGPKLIGTLFGHRRGHVHFAFQEDFKQSPAFLVELATPTSVLVREMASGLVRIALECDKKADKKGPCSTTSSSRQLLVDEPAWRTYCNGKKCGYAMMRRECGPEEWKVLNAIGPISMGAGVLPWTAGEESHEGEMMYMRAKFERVVGSKDSEAFYMMNPDGNGGPELSIYLLRV